ncbi:MAG: hypothetical protein GVY21_04890, partial [Gammaproteobacteria bacterium]|nr:hypothetical protein [Gammaproteobacteria bacterium]
MSRKNEQAASAWGRLGSERDEEARRRQALESPGDYHGDIAAAELHWFDPDGTAWLARDPIADTWQGFDAARGEPVGESERAADWRPWERGFDDSDAPFYRWFAGGLTNASFNEVDRHVLDGRGARPAFVFEGD